MVTHSFCIRSLTVCHDFIHIQIQTKLTHYARSHRRHHRDITIRTTPRSRMHYHITPLSECGAILLDGGVSPVIKRCVYALKKSTGFAPSRLETNTKCIGQYTRYQIYRIVCLAESLSFTHLYYLLCAIHYTGYWTASRSTYYMYYSARTVRVCTHDQSLTRSLQPKCTTFNAF